MLYNSHNSVTLCFQHRNKVQNFMDWKYKAYSNITHKKFKMLPLKFHYTS